MAMPFRSASELTEAQRTLVARLLESHGRHELASAHVLAAAVPLAPSLDDKILLIEHAREELDHFESAAVLYEELDAGDLLSKVAPGAARVPRAESWLEVAFVQFLFCRAGKLQLREYAGSTYRPYAEIVAKILREEEEHGAAGEATLRELCREPPHAEKAQACFERWLRISLLSFASWTAAGRQGATLGLRARESGAVIRDYLADIAPAISACALRLPSRRELGIDLPQDIPLG